MKPRRGRSEVTPEKPKRGRGRRLVRVATPKGDPSREVIDVEHANLYVGSPRTMYESRCNCGWTVIMATVREAQQEWDAHRFASLGTGPKRYRPKWPR